MINTHQLLSLLNTSIMNPEPDKHPAHIDSLRDIKSLVLMYGNAWDLGVMPVNRSEAEEMAHNVGMDTADRKGFIELSETIENLLNVSTLT